MEKMAESQMTDPIFAAIEANRSAVAAINAAGAQDASDEEIDRLGDISDETWQTLLHTKPTTAAGLLAFMDYACTEEASAFLNLGEDEGTFEAWKAVKEMIRALV
jgi:hypothetical protein